MPQINYKQEKRQRELEKKKKKDQKIKNKVGKKPVQSTENTTQTPEK